MSDGRSVPDSCCYEMTPHCGKNALITKHGIYFDGCVHPLDLYFTQIFTTLIGMNSSIAIVAAASCFISLYLKQYMKKRYESF
jgi:hypothetical protein